jgi:hypothetical protein
MDASDDLRLMNIRNGGAGALYLEVGVCEKIPIAQQQRPARELLTTSQDCQGDMFSFRAWGPSFGFDR